MSTASSGACCGRSRSAFLAVLGFALLLGGCKTDLFTKRTEAEANDMVAALMARDIAVEKKTVDAGKSWNILIDETDMVAALNVLRAEGLPHEKFVNLGDIFKKDGLISTPTEERVRFMHGVTQELSNTLSKIDGVVVAKVHIVLPNNDPLSPNVKPSSASVFVKHRPSADLPSLTPAIKNLVARSVEGLAYENVTVTLVQGSVAPPSATRSSGAAMSPWLMLAALALGMLLVGSAVGVALWRPGLLPESLRRRLPGRSQPAGG